MALIRDSQRAEAVKGGYAGEAQRSEPLTARDVETEHRGPSATTVGLGPLSAHVKRRGPSKRLTIPHRMHGGIDSPGVTDRHRISLAPVTLLVEVTRTLGNSATKHLSVTANTVHVQTGPHRDAGSSLAQPRLARFAGDPDSHAGADHRLHSG